MSEENQLFPGDLSGENNATFFLQTVKKYQLLTKQEEIELAQKIEAGDQQAFEQFVNANLRLVVKIAKECQLPTPLVDRIQYGNIGLIRAVRKFDWRKGNRFSTMAFFWIRQTILREGTDNERIIHLPQLCRSEIYRMLNVIDELTQEVGDYPNASEIARRLKCSVEYATDLVAVNDLGPISLDRVINHDGADETLFDLVEDPDAHLVAEDQMLLKEKLRPIKRALNKINPRHRRAIEMRYGLNGEREHTLEEIGQKFKVTRQRARHIIIAGIKKIRVIIQKNRQNGRK